MHPSSVNCSLSVTNTKRKQLRRSHIAACISEIHHGRTKGMVASKRYSHCQIGHVSQKNSGLWWFSVDGGAYEAKQITLLHRPGTSWPVVSSRSTDICTKQYDKQWDIKKAEREREYVLPASHNSYCCGLRRASSCQTTANNILEMGGYRHVN